MKNNKNNDKKTLFNNYTNDNYMRNLYGFNYYDGLNNEFAEESENPEKHYNSNSKRYTEDNRGYIDNYGYNEETSKELNDYNNESRNNYNNSRQQNNQCNRSQNTSNNSQHNNH